MLHDIVFLNKSLDCIIYTEKKQSRVPFALLIQNKLIMELPKLYFIYGSGIKEKVNFLENLQLPMNTYALSVGCQVGNRFAERVRGGVHFWPIT